MKVASKSSNKVWQPVELTITLENEKEAEALYAFFNYTTSNEKLLEYGINLTEVRAAIEDAVGHRVEYYDAFQDLLTMYRD